MKYPPIGHDPGTWTVYNGAAVRANHAIEIDRATTWLAARRYNLPAPIGQFVDGGSTLEMRISVPLWTSHCNIGVVATGRGYVTITSADDTYNCRLPINGPGQGISAAEHTVTAAGATVTAGPLSSVAAHNLNRAIDVDVDDLNTIDLLFTVAVDDYDVTHSVRVYAIKLMPLHPGEDSVLPG